MRWIRALVLTVGVLSGCGPSAEVDEAPAAGEASQVEQGIGVTPHCSSTQYLAEKIVWKDTCAACSEVGGSGGWVNGTYGRGGNLYQTCCGAGGCGAWKLIRPVCTSCELAIHASP
jgi:hypothetical protein